MNKNAGVLQYMGAPLQPTVSGWCGMWGPKPVCVPSQLRAFNEPTFVTRDNKNHETRACPFWFNQKLNRNSLKCSKEHFREESGELSSLNTFCCWTERAFMDIRSKWSHSARWLLWMPSNRNLILWCNRMSDISTSHCLCEGDLTALQTCHNLENVPQTNTNR